MTFSDQTIKKPSVALLKSWLALTKEQHRRETGRFLAEGFKVVQELIQSSWTTESLLLLATKEDQYRHFLQALPSSIPVYFLPEANWRKLTQDKNPEGIMAVAVDHSRRKQDHRPTPSEGHLIFLDQTNNPNNLGAIMRAAHWFGIRNLVISRGSVDYTNPKVVRASMGSLFHLNICANVSAYDYLAGLRGKYLLAATTPMGSINPHPCHKPTVLILGSESHGLPAEILSLADERWTVPGLGEAESLSLPQAAAIIMYECTRFSPKGATL